MCEREVRNRGNIEVDHTGFTLFAVLESLLRTGDFANRISRAWGGKKFKLLSEITACGVVTTKVLGGPY